jgi:DNA replication protein DnaC
MSFIIPTDWKSVNWWRNRSPEERFFHTKIPTRWDNFNFDTMTIDPSCSNEVTTWLKEYTTGKNLFLYGRTGVGKSVIGQALLKRLILTKPLSGRFVSSDRYIEMLKDTFESDSGLLPEMYSMPYLLKYISGVFDIVILDGVGQERETEFSVHEIGTLIRRRYEDSRSTIITTSLAPMDFIRRYGDRVKVAVMDMEKIKVS